MVSSTVANGRCVYTMGRNLSMMGQPLTTMYRPIKDPTPYWTGERLWYSRDSLRMVMSASSVDRQSLKASITSTRLAAIGQRGCRSGSSGQLEH